MKIQNNVKTGTVQTTRKKSISKTSAAKKTGGVAKAKSSAGIFGIPQSEMTPRVQNAIMTLMSEVDDMRNELELAHRRISELEQLADMDSLISVSNRRAFVREMTRMISYSERYGINSSLIYLDMNDLKLINDNHGHAAGDAALKELASIVTQNLRDSDIFGRLGGDEFGIILPKANEEDANVKAKKLLETIQSAEFMWNDIHIPLNVAYGIYPLRSGESADQALEQADKKMYVHKKTMKSKK